MIEHVIHLVGHHDKAVLVASTLVGLFVVSAVVGILALRSIAAAQLAFVVMGVVLVLAVHARLTPSSGTYIPPILGVAIAIVVLALLRSPARAAVAASASLRSGSDPAPSTASPATPAPTHGSAWQRMQAEELESRRRSLAPDPQSTRRSFLLLSGAVALSAVAVGTTGRVLAHGRAAVEAARRKLTLKITNPAEPAGVDIGVKGIASWQTSQDNFYRIDTALAIPEILPADWSLHVHGMVDKELVLSYDDLVGRGITEDWLTLCCVSNEVGGNLISNAWFSGVLIRDILAEAGPQAGADAVKSTSDDGWTAGTPLSVLTDPHRNAMFAVAMNGQPLEPEHGFPVRMVVPVCTDTCPAQSGSWTSR